MRKILVSTESSSEKDAKRFKQIYCTSSGSGDMQEKRKVEKQGDVFFCYRLYHTLRKIDFFGCHKIFVPQINASFDTFKPRLID